MPTEPTAKSAETGHPAIKSRTATQIALYALSSLVTENVPIETESPAARRLIDEIHRRDGAVIWRQSRRRFPNTGLAYRELHRALDSASEAVSALLARAVPGSAEVPDCLRLALVTAVARRDVIDGSRFAEAAVRACHKAIDLVEVTQSNDPPGSNRR